MKDTVPRVLAALAPLSIFGFLGWTLSLHGTVGFLHVDDRSWFVAAGLGLVGIVPPILLLAGRSGWKKHAVNRLKLPAIVIACLAIAISLLAFAYISGFSSFSPGNIAPHVEVTDRVGANGVPDVAVIAYSRVPIKETLTWGKESEPTTVTEDKAKTNHVFILSDLDPGVQYYYKLGDSAPHHFSTPDVSSGALHFAVGSDTHIGAGDNREDLTEKMLQQIANPDNHFDYFFSLGDLVEYGFRENQWDEAFRVLSPTISVIPTTFVPGNHDVLFTGLGRYLDYCAPAGVDSETSSRLWQRIDIGHVHFLILDVEWSAESITDEQVAWLEDQLKSIPATDWKIVLSHGFYYASGSVSNGWRWYDNPETIQRLTPLFEKYGVDLVFSGHDHQMELLQKSGVTYVVEGAFGGIPDPPRTYTSPASLWYAAGQYGFADVTIKGPYATVTFRSAEGTDLKTTVVTKRSP